MLRLVLRAIALIALFALPVHAEERLPRTFLRAEPIVDVLPNGLTVVTVPTGPAGVVAYFALVRVGSRDEVEPGRTGFAHLFEHMMFRGTEGRPGPEYERTLQGFGASHNAYTTSDYTLYTITVPSQILPELVAVEAERFQRLRVDDEGFRTEAGAVLGEYAASASDPFETIWRTLSGLAFPTHPYGHTTIGHLEDICRFAQHADDARAFFRRYYTPDDVTLFVVGDVTRDELLPLVTRYYGAWAGRRDTPPIPIEPEPTRGARRDLVWAGAAEPTVWVGYRTPSFAGGDAAPAAERARALRESAALEIVHALAFSEASPLYRRLVVEERVALSLGSWSGDFHRDPGLFVANAVLADPAHADLVIDAIGDAVRDVARGRRDAAFADARSHLRYSRIAAVRTVDDAAELLAMFTAVGGRASTLAEYLAAFDAVTLEDVRAVAARYLDERRRYVVTLRGEPDAASEASAGSLCGGAP